MRLKQFILLAMLTSTLCLVGCKREGCTDALATNFDEKAKKDDGNCIYDTTSNSSSFDQKDMLVYMANDIIVPRFKNLSESTQSLKVAVDTFTSNPTNGNLALLRSAFRTSYISYQWVEMFEIGPGQDSSMRSNLNTYPTDTQNIHKVFAGNLVPNFEMATYMDMNGYPALEYLLFGTDSTVTIEWYTSYSDKAERLAYLSRLSNQLNNTLLGIYNAWVSSYLSTFTNSTNTTGSARGSSLALLANEFSLDFENIKTYRIGIPLGIATLGYIAPEKVEGLYAGNSIALASNHLRAIREVYEGISYETKNDSLGFYDYLVFKNATSIEGDPLGLVISTQLNLGQDYLDAIPDPLTTSLETQKALVESAYTQLQKTVGYIKRDMMSNLEVLVNYTDSDGD